MPFASGQSILRPRFKLERGPISSERVSEAWVTVNEYGEHFLAKLWPYEGDEPDELQRALWDSELRTLYRVGSSPGADDNILVIKDAGLDRGNRCFAMILEGHPPATSGYDTLESLFGQRSHFGWLSNRDSEARRELWLGLARVAAGLRLLHDQFVLHRNVDTANIFLEPRIGPRSFRLAGFEWSLRLGVPGNRRPPNGWSSPPEFFQESSYVYRVETDWFAFGMLVARCLLSLENYASNEPVARHARVLQEVRKTSRISDLEKAFLLRLIAVDPGERLSRADDVRTTIHDVVAALQGADPADDERPLVIVINPTSSELLERLELVGYKPDPSQPLEDFNPNNLVHVSNLAHFVQVDLVEAQLYAVADAEFVVLVGARLQFILLPYDDAASAQGPKRSWDLAFCAGPGELRWNEGGTARVDLPKQSIVVRTVRQIRNDSTVRSGAKSWTRFLPSIDRTSRLRASLGRFHEFIRCTNQLELLIRDAEIFAYEQIGISDDELGETLQIKEAVRARPVAQFCRLDRGLADFLLREIESNKPYCKRVVLTGLEQDGLGTERIAPQDCWEIVSSNPESGVVELARPSGIGKPKPPKRGHIRTWGMFGQVALIRRRKRAIDRLEQHSYLLRSLSAPGQVFMDTGPLDLPVQQRLDRVDESKQAVMQDILRVRPIYALQGPPGTGKTTLVAHLVRQILKDDPVAQILITAQAHGAVDVLRAKVRDEAFSDVDEAEQPLAVRLGTEGELEEGSVEEVSRKILIVARDKLTGQDVLGEIQQVWLESINEMLIALQTVTPDRVAPDFCENVKRGANLTYCTTSSAGLEALAEGTQSFDWSILEEAGKAHGFDLALPLQAGHRWLLIGDQKQLPPYRFEDYRKGIDDLDRAVESLETLSDRGAGLLDAEWAKSWWDRSDAERNEFKEYLRLWLNTFDRVFTLCSTASGQRVLTGDSANGSAAGMLTRQYRMHPLIGRLISEVFYRGEIQSMTQDEGLKAKDHVTHRFVKPSELSNTAIAWLDIPWAKINPACAERGPQTRHARYSNIGELKALKWLLKNLSWSGSQQVDPIEFAVLAPYTQQVALINQRLGGEVNLEAPVVLKPDLRSRTTVQRQQGKRRVAYTVDSFQGNEADVIAVSLVRNNTKPPREGLGFLDEAPRINVLLSRAERLLILIGSWDFFMNQVAAVHLDDEKDPLWHWKKTMVLLEEWHRAGLVSKFEPAITWE
jgi:hypothetical protein